MVLSEFRRFNRIDHRVRLSLLCGDRVLTGSVATSPDRHHSIGTIAANPYQYLLAFGSLFGHELRIMVFASRRQVAAGAEGAQFAIRVRMG